MVNVKRLRCSIGWLGMLLPWLVVLLLWEFPESISATYYTYVGAVFIGILGSASILLMHYEGYDKSDDVLNTIGGCLGVGICLFPCNNDELSFVGTFQLPTGISSILHNIFAVSFFLILAYNTLFQFTKSGGNMTKSKKARNVIYRISGIGMLCSFLLLFLPVYNKIWITEAIALFFFGISWLTKANYYKWLFAEKE